MVERDVNVSGGLRTNLTLERNLVSSPPKKHKKIKAMLTLRGLGLVSHVRKIVFFLHGSVKVALEREVGTHRVTGSAATGAQPSARAGIPNLTSQF